MNGIVTDGRTLRGMTKAGFIVWQSGQTDKHWTGSHVKVYYVREGNKLANWYDVFEYRGKAYRLRYFDGCFKPFVTELGAQLPSFV